MCVYNCVCVYMGVGEGAYVCACANVFVYACAHSDEKCSMWLKLVQLFTSSITNNGTTANPPLYPAWFINEHYGHV